MPPQNGTPSRKPQGQLTESLDSTTARPRRKRLAEVHRGALALLDATVEARRSSEEPAREHEITRADVQDLFAWETRRLVRQLQSEIRILRRAA